METGNPRSTSLHKSPYWLLIKRICRKKKSKSTQEKVKDVPEKDEEAVTKDDVEASTASSSKSKRIDNRTEAERKFDETQKKRVRRTGFVRCTKYLRLGCPFEA